MALKDWKKISGSNLKNLRFTNGVYIVSLRETVFDEENKKWVVSTGTIGLSYPTYFKTKSQALRFARAYMRAH